jgi:hypothetical protein
MNYDQARGRIQTGDLIGVRDVHGLLGKATVFFTGSPYTHTGVAVWLGDRLFMADLNSGRNHLTALSCIESFDVLDPPAGIDRKFIEQATFDWLAHPITYGYAAFILIGLKDALGVKKFIHWRKIIVCSGGSIQIYEMAVDAMLTHGENVPPAWVDHDRTLSPGDLVAELGVPKLQVRP